MKRVIRFFLAAVLCLFACKKEAGPKEDKTPPVVTFSSPANNQSFAGFSSVTVSATVTDNVRLKEVHLEILNKSTGSLLTHEHFEPTNAYCIVSSSFVISPATAFEIKVEAQDSTGNNAAAVVNVSAN